MAATHIRKAKTACDRESRRLPKRKTTQAASVNGGDAKAVMKVQLNKLSPGAPRTSNIAVTVASAAGAASTHTTPSRTREPCGTSHNGSGKATLHA